MRGGVRLSCPGANSGGFSLNKGSYASAGPYQSVGVRGAEGGPGLGATRGERGPEPTRPPRWSTLPGRTGIALVGGVASQLRNRVGVARRHLGGADYIFTLVPGGGPRRYKNPVKKSRKPKVLECVLFWNYDEQGIPKAPSVCSGRGKGSRVHSGRPERKNDTRGRGWKVRGEPGARCGVFCEPGSRAEAAGACGVGGGFGLVPAHTPHGASGRAHGGAHSLSARP